MTGDNLSVHTGGMPISGVPTGGASRLPAGGAWMGAFYILPCTDAEAHFKQAATIMDANKAEVYCDITYNNALYCGVYPCFIEEAADVDATCIAIAWNNDVFDLVIESGWLLARAMLAYHRGLTEDGVDNWLKVVADAIKCKLESNTLELNFELWGPHTPIYAWMPAPGGAAALATLQPLFPKKPMVVPAGYSEDDLERSNPYNQWMYEG